MNATASGVRFGDVSLATGVRLHYAESGSASEVILFLHGYTDSWYSFSSVLIGGPGLDTLDGGLGDDIEMQGCADQGTPRVGGACAPRPLPLPPDRIRTRLSPLRKRADLMPGSHSPHAKALDRVRGSEGANDWLTVNALTVAVGTQACASPLVGCPASMDGLSMRPLLPSLALRAGTTRPSKLRDH
jgi:hypothetical protein